MPGILDELMRAFANTQAAEEAHFDSTPSDGSSGVPSVGDLFIPSERDAFLPDEQSAPEEILPLLAEIKNAYAAGPSGERDISTDFANAIMRGGGTFSKTGDSGRVLDNLGAHNHPDSASSRAAADAKLNSTNRDEDLKRFLMELAQSNKDREFDFKDRSLKSESDLGSRELDLKASEIASRERIEGDKLNARSEQDRQTQLRQKMADLVNKRSETFNVADRIALEREIASLGGFDTGVLGEDVLKTLQVSAIPPSLLAAMVGRNKGRLVAADDRTDRTVKVLQETLQALSGRPGDTVRTDEILAYLLSLKNR